MDCMESGPRVEGRYFSRMRQTGYQATEQYHHKRQGHDCFLTPTFDYDVVQFHLIELNHG
jgi:hypothetical protein